MTEQAQGQAAAETQGTQAQGAQETAETQDQATEERTFTQADLNKIAANEKRDGRNSVLSELGFEDFDELKSTVEAYRGIEEASSTEADKLQKQLDKLSPRAEKAERYEKVLNTLLEKEREGLPEHITSLLDGRDPDAQLAWIAENREAIAEAQKPQTVGRGSAPGSGGGVSPDVAPGMGRLRVAYEKR